MPGFNRHVNLINKFFEITLVMVSLHLLTVVKGLWQRGIQHYWAIYKNLLTNYAQLLLELISDIKRIRKCYFYAKI